MSPLPKITVLVASYNGERFVGDTVRSILAQTLRDFELVVLDDGDDRDPRRHRGWNAGVDRGIDGGAADGGPRRRRPQQRGAHDLASRTRLAR